MRRFYSKPWLIVAIIAAITVFFALQLPHVGLDNNNFRFVPRDDAARLQADRISEIFGSQTYILVGLQRQFDSILDADFLLTLQDYCESVRTIPIVDQVVSLADTDYISGDGYTVSVEPLMQSGEQLDLLAQRLNGWDIYRRFLVSDRLDAVQVVVSLDVPTDEAGSPEVLEAYETMKQLALDAGFEDTIVHVAGLPVMSAEISKSTRRDIIVLVPLVIIVVIVVLLISFRRFGGVFLPLLNVLVAVVWAIGAMPLLGVKLTVISTVLPVILIAVGSAYGIHIVSHWYDLLGVSGPLDRERHRELVFEVLHKVGRPVALAALTTFSGFVSFCFTRVTPIFEFGVFASFGVLVAFVIAVTLIPSLLLIRGPESSGKRPVPAAVEAMQKKFQNFTLSPLMADSLLEIVRHRRTVSAIAILAFVFSLIGLSNLVIDNVFVEYFKDDTEVVQADAFVRSVFGGSKSVSLVVSHEQAGQVLRPDVLEAMDRVQSYVEQQIPEVGKVNSFTELIKRVNQVLNADTEVFSQTASAAGVASAASAASFAGAAAQEDTAEPAFGFGGQSAIAEEQPAFGFGDWDSASSETTPLAVESVESVESSAAAIPADSLSAVQLAALLNDALAAAGPNANARDLVNGLRRSVNLDGAAFYEVPTQPERYGKTSMEELHRLILNYMVLLSGDISSFANDSLEPTAIRMNLQLRTTGQLDTDRVLHQVRDYAAGVFPEDVQLEIGGIPLVEGSLNKLVVESQLLSVIISLLMVFLIISVYYRSMAAGLMALITVGTAILVNFAVMGFSGIRLNIGTALVASAAVGIGIDYTIHYLAAYKNEYLASAGEGDYLRRTFMTCGKAIIFNAVSVGLGFAVLLLSQFNILAQLGGLIALTMATSSLASLTLLPVMLSVFNPKFVKEDKNEK